VSSAFCVCNVAAMERPLPILSLLRNGWLYHTVSSASTIVEVHKQLLQLIFSAGFVAHTQSCCYEREGRVHDVYASPTPAWLLR